jgi:hypothetical protein
VSTIDFCGYIIEDFPEIRLRKGILQLFPPPGKIPVHAVFAGIPVKAGMGFFQGFLINIIIFL